MVVDTPVIILKSVSYSESSLIVTLLSQKHGKIAVMARGARRNKNKFGGLLEPGSILEASYYYKPTREVQNLSDVSIGTPTWNIHKDIGKMAVGLGTIELCEQLCHAHEPMPEVFTFLCQFLAWLHGTNENPKNLFPYIQFRLAQLVGIGMGWDEDFPGSDEPPVPEKCYLNVENGSVSCTPAGQMHFLLTKSQVHYLRCIRNNRKNLLLTEPYPATDIKNLIHHFDVYFQYHLEGVRPRRSDAIFEQIL